MTKLYIGIISLFIIIIGIFSYEHFTASAVPTTYYVSNSLGNDANNGTSSATPWKTINKVVTSESIFVPGQTICFYGGDVWTSTATSGVNAAELDISGVNGTPAKPITFGTCAGFGTSMPATIDGANLTPLGVNGIWGNNFTFNVTLNNSYVTISGFTIKHVWSQAIYFIPNVAGADKGIVIQNNIVQDTGPGCSTSSTGCVGTDGFADWVQNTAYVANTHIGPLLNNTGNFTYTTSLACTSGANAQEPNPWNQTIGGTSTEGTCTWTNTGINNSTYQNQVGMNDPNLGADDGLQIIGNTIKWGGGHNLLQVHYNEGSNIVVSGNTVGPGGVHGYIDVKGIGNVNSAALISNNICIGGIASGLTGAANNYCFFESNQFNPNANVQWFQNVGYDTNGGIFICPGGVPNTFTAGETDVVYNNSFYLPTAANSTNGIFFSSATCGGTNIGTLSPRTLKVENNLIDGGNSNSSTFSIDASASVWSPCTEKYNDIGGAQGKSGFQTCGGSTTLPITDLNNVNPIYQNIGTPSASNPPLAYASTSPLFFAGDPMLNTGNNNIGAYATTASPTPPVGTPTPSPGTPTPSSTATPTTTPTPQVNQTLKNLHAFGSLGFVGLGGNGDYIDQVNLDDFIYPKAYGAKCDGTTDDSVAFSNAMAVVNAKQKTLLLPNYTCLVNVTLTLSASGAGIMGFGMNNSTLTTSTANLVQINVTAKNFRLSNFTLTRSITATAGGFGISIPQFVAGPTLDHILVKNAFVGFNLSSASYARLEHLQTFNDVSDGVLMTQDGLGNALQWTIDDVLSELSTGGSGFHVVGTTLTNLAPWRQPYTFSNAQYGIDLEDTAGIADVQIDDWVSSADCFSGININGGLNVVIANGYEEFAGKFSSVTCTPPTGFGFGISLTTVQLGEVNINNNILTQNLTNGINDGSPRNVIISNNNIKLNGANGINIIGSSPGITQINGGFSQSNNQFGLAINGTKQVYENGLICAGNLSGNKVGMATSVVGGSC